MDKDSKFTRDADGYVAVRTVSAPYSSGSDDKDSMFTRDADGYVAVRVTGAGGGGSDPHNLGYYADLTALQTAHPTGSDGDFAILGSTDTIWIWDSETSAWKDSDQKGQVTSVNNQTGAVTLGINDVAPTQTDKSGYVLGTDGFVAGWVRPEIVQRSALPQASEDEVNKIYQYIGATDANYTNGYFYKCVSDGGNPATYSWVRTDVQPTPNELPTQTGNSGKFLTTDGTDASWATISQVPSTTGTTQGDVLTIDAQGDPIWQASSGGLPSQTGNAGKVLTTNGTNASWETTVSTGFTVLGTDSSKIVIKSGSSYTGNLYFEKTGTTDKSYIGTTQINNAYDTIRLCFSYNNGNTWDQFYWSKGGSTQNPFFAPGNIGNRSYDLGKSNLKWNALYCTKLNNGSDITVPNVAGEMAVKQVNTTITLAAASWSSNTQTVNVTGMTATGVVFPCPVPADQADYTDAGIICSAQAAGTLTFTCDTTPTNDIDVQIVML